MTFTSEILNSFAPWTAYDANGDHTAFLQALAGMFEQVWAIVAPQGFPGDPSYVPSWESLFDPTNTPFPIWLSQFNGTDVPAGTDTADARSILLAESGFSRGTPAAMIAAAQRNLTGTLFCVLQERTAANGSPDPYHAIVAYHAAECPNVQAMISAVNAIKPAGIQITFEAVSGFPWNTAQHTWNADAFSWNAAATNQP